MSSLERREHPSHRAAFAGTEIVAGERIGWARGLDLRPRRGKGRRVDTESRYRVRRERDFGDGFISFRSLSSLSDLVPLRSRMVIGGSRR
ncbi:unnamed protein product [Arabis nemorensis]|uniref:Uncharacterized protein n=1 Tax=Arabis nemorensis TaxID=586526 RepID=A0A565AS19_9BRAS|nr:unnamed protein product [Arabis nemorensis]